MSHEPAILSEVRGFDPAFGNKQSIEHLWLVVSVYMITKSAMGGKQ